MRLLLVSPANLASGRGAENVLGNVLAGLAARAEVRVMALGPVDEEFARAADVAGVPTYPLRYRCRGWFVRDTADIARTVTTEARRFKADLVVLYWEIWDLVRGLRAPLAAAGVPFAVLLHAIPFAFAPAQARRFYPDAIRRVLRDRDLLGVVYALRRLYGVGRTLAKVRVISANETVSYYLRRYFAGLDFAEVVPGAAVEPPDLPARVGRTHDCVFMAALEPGKGIFALPDILAAVVARRPGARLLVLGTFVRDADERRFRAMLDRRGLRDRVDLAGWVRGTEKTARLAGCGVFVYPSYAADTFALALLEALACGVPAVAFDVPFVRAVYASDAVRRVPTGDTDAFAADVVALLDDDARHRRLAAAARAHAADRSCWDTVAAAQIRAFAWAAR